MKGTNQALNERGIRRAGGQDEGCNPLFAFRGFNLMTFREEVGLNGGGKKKKNASSWRGKRRACEKGEGSNTENNTRILIRKNRNIGWLGRKFFVNSVKRRGRRGGGSFGKTQRGGNGIGSPLGR